MKAKSFMLSVVEEIRKNFHDWIFTHLLESTEYCMDFNDLHMESDLNDWLAYQYQ